MKMQRYIVKSGVHECQELKDEIKKWGYIFVGNPEDPDDNIGIVGQVFDQTYECLLFKPEEVTMEVLYFEETCDILSHFRKLLGAEDIRLLSLWYGLT